MYLTVLNIKLFPIEILSSNLTSLSYTDSTNHIKRHNKIIPPIQSGLHSSASYKPRRY